MDNIQSALANSIQTIVDDALKKNQSIGILTGTITEISDASTNSYKVSCNGDIYDAYTNVANIRYSVGDNVYLSVPYNDYSRGKIILGTTTPADLSVLKANALVNVSEIPTENLFGIVNNGNVIEISSYNNLTNVEVSFTNSNLLDDLNTFLEQGLTDFVFSCSFKTSFESTQRDIVKYGIYLEIPFKDGISTISLSSDGESMKGDPYSYESLTKQSISFSLEEKEIDTTGTIKLYYTCNNSQIAENGQSADLLMCSPKLYLKEDNETEGLIIYAENSSIFKTSDNSKIMSAYLYVDGLKYSESVLDFYWFVEDGDVQSKDDVNYSEYAGVGWRCINSYKVDETNETTLKLDCYLDTKGAYRQRIFKSMVTNNTKFKCVACISGTSYSYSKVFSLYRKVDIEENYLFKISAPKNNNLTFVKDLEQVRLKGAFIESDNGVNYDIPQSNANILYYYEWNYYNEEEIIPLNEYILSSLEEYSEVEFPTSIISDNTALIKCIVYRLNLFTFEKEIVATDEINIIFSDVINNLIINNSTATYYYNEYGLLSESNVIEPLTFSVYHNGTELSDYEYENCNIKWKIPKKSFLLSKDGDWIDGNDGYYYYNGMELNFNLIKVYDYTLTNNQILLTVTLGNSSLYRSINLSFVKGGKVEKDFKYLREVKILINEEEDIPLFFDGGAYFNIHNYNSGMENISAESVTLSCGVYDNGIRNTDLEIKPVFSISNDACFSLSGNVLKAKAVAKKDITSANILKMEVTIEGVKYTEYYPLLIVDFDSKSGKEKTKAKLLTEIEGLIDKIEYSNKIDPIYNHIGFSFNYPSEIISIDEENIKAFPNTNFSYNVKDNILSIKPPYNQNENIDGFLLEVPFTSEEESFIIGDLEEYNRIRKIINNFSSYKNISKKYSEVEKEINSYLNNLKEIQYDRYRVSYWVKKVYSKWVDFYDYYSLYKDSGLIAGIGDHQMENNGFNTQIKKLYENTKAIIYSTDSTTFLKTNLYNSNSDRDPYNFPLCDIEDSVTIKDEAIKENFLSKLNSYNTLAKEYNSIIFNIDLTPQKELADYLQIYIDYFSGIKTAIEEDISENYSGKISTLEEFIQNIISYIPEIKEEDGFNFLKIFIYYDKIINLLTYYKNNLFKEENNSANLVSSLKSNCINMFLNILLTYFSDDDTGYRNSFDILKELLLNKIDKIIEDESILQGYFNYSYNIVLYLSIPSFSK